MALLRLTELADKPAPAADRRCCGKPRQVMWVVITGEEGNGMERKLGGADLGDGSGLI